MILFFVVVAKIWVSGESSKIFIAQKCTQKPSALRKGVRKNL